MKPEPPLITAVIVLYNSTAAESEAVVSLRGVLSTQLDFADSLLLVFYDNSAEPASLDRAGFPCEVRYRHDPANGGLASAYNHALEQAQNVGSEWLLLLDQDTTLTPGYFSELLSIVRRKNVSILVPFIEMTGRIYSPEATFLYHLRHQFPSTRDYPVSRDASGMQTGRLNAYNSGAAIRVDALMAIGGFPAEFRLDYLDHAVFHLLQRHGYQLYLLRAALQQKLSHIDLNAVPYARHRSVLDSQTLFVARYGTWLDRLLFRLWVLRKSRLYRSLCKDPRVWREMVARALGRWPRSLSGGLP